MSANERLNALLPTIGILVLVAVFLFSMEEALGIGLLVQMPGAELIIPLLSIVILIGLYSSLIKKSSIWLVFERTGIPIGILFSTIYLVSVANGVFGTASKDFLTYAFAILIIGCFVSVIGYLLKRESLPTEPRPVSFAADLGFAALIVLIIALTMEQLTGLIVFYDMTMMVTLAPVLALALTNYKTASPRRYMQAIIVGVTGVIFLSVMNWTMIVQEDTGESIGPAIAIGLISMTHGALVILISACLFSDITSYKIDFDKINWHLLELFALIILMVFAPESVWEWAARVNPSPT